MRFVLDGEILPLEMLSEWAKCPTEVGVSESAQKRMAESRAVVESAVVSGKPTYGVNTGFGQLSEVSIPITELEALQVNLIRSHACGFGPVLSVEESRAMVLLRANSLTKGLSGIRPSMVEKLLDLVRLDLIPVIPSRGSVGASGDLAPLAHMALALLGEGKVWVDGEPVSMQDVVRAGKWDPMLPQAKEGLALLNGTQAINAVGGLAIFSAQELLNQWSALAALTVDTLLGTPTAFDSRIHAARGHVGQVKVAHDLTEWLRGSQLRESHEQNDPRVQDAYSMRCIPQVHGASLDILNSARTAFEVETAAANDNPLVFAETNEVLSGGNFHGAPLALWLDACSNAVIHVASMAERRMERLLNPTTSERLPAFLAPHAGVESGLMIVHVAAAAALNEMCTGAHPASVYNIPTSAGKEDHVSMGMTAALKLKRTVELACTVFCCEAITANRAYRMRAPLKTSPQLSEWVESWSSVQADQMNDQVFADVIDSWQSELCSRIRLF